ncbi:MAG TPA: CoA-binding protein [Polyangiaceae bacterium]|jgi:predicted CoA-binding protein|nr:CoA-binding protein [Polyangiaceae bacterium]
MDTRRILEQSRTVAVLGAHVEPERAAHYVPAYLAEHGYRILPVNPVFVGQTLFGAPVLGTLREIAEPIDVVDVFRRSEHLAQHLDDILAMNPKPRVVWLQLGIHDPDFERAIEEAGIELVVNRCMLADHRHMGTKGQP